VQTQVVQSSTAQWLSFLTPLLVAVLTYVQLMTAKLAASKVSEVKHTLEASTANATQKLNEIAIVADKTHILVNSQMGQQLMMYAITARTLADLTHKPEHIKAAEEADQKLSDHVAKQHLVDTKESKE
jgi:hypothetical protein